MLKVLYEDWLGLSAATSSQSSYEMCTAARNCEKNY